MADKRDRSANFTEMDKELLLTIVSDNFFNVIENKKIDGTTIKEKSEAWEHVAFKFNAGSSNGNRTATQLKNAYNNIKRKLKKENADEKVEIYKSGGGIPSTPKMSDSKSRLLGLLKPNSLQLQPLHSEYDSSTESIECSTIQEPSILTVEPVPSTSTDVSVVALDSPGVDEIPFSAAQMCSVESDAEKPARSLKRKLADMYDCVEQLTETKSMTSNTKNIKDELEIEILLLKKKREEEKQEIHLLQLKIEKEKLLQEEFKRKQEEVRLQIEKERLKRLVKDDID